MGSDLHMNPPASGTRLRWLNHDTLVKEHWNEFNGDVDDNANWHEETRFESPSHDLLVGLAAGYKVPMRPDPEPPVNYKLLASLLDLPDNFWQAFDRDTQRRIASLWGFHQ
jgi:hypothetical protein